MVKVNLEYNPYVMELKARFNGKEPRINSLIEKYEKIPLQMWMKDIPRILYDEMNGYDFDLEFIGPKLEYEDLISTFRKAGISSDTVRCVHTKSLESRNQKLIGIIALNNWLEMNTNARFDFDSFKIENQDIFDNSHSIILIGNTNIGDFEFNNISVSIENILDIQELDNTELKNIPIIIDAEIMSVKDLQNVLTYIDQNNSDVTHKQFFIFVRTKTKLELFKRLIEDIGFGESHVIVDLKNNYLRKYFEYYPVSDYIRDYISVIRKRVNELKEKLDVEKEESEKVNGEVMSQITMIEEHISVIKESISSLDEINKTILINEWDFAINELIEKITSWKIKKTKITNDEEANKLAEQFEDEIKLLWTKFIQLISSTTVEKKNNILKICTDIYDTANKSQTPINFCETKFDSRIKLLDGIRYQLLLIKESSYEKPKDGLINSFLKEIADITDNKQAVMVTTYPCQKWREYVVEYLTPIMMNIIENRNDEIQEFCGEISNYYIDNLSKLLEEREEDKNNFSKRLSSDIQILQKDCDWLNEFIDKLEMLERS